jgi:hypothetical protein
MTSPESAQTQQAAGGGVLEVGWHNVVVSYEGVAEE